MHMQGCGKKPRNLVIDRQTEHIGHHCVNYMRCWSLGDLLAQKGATSTRCCQAFATQVPSTCAITAPVLSQRLCELFVKTSRSPLQHRSAVMACPDLDHHCWGLVVLDSAISATALQGNCPPVLSPLLPTAPLPPATAARHVPFGSYECMCSHSDCILARTFSTA